MFNFSTFDVYNKKTPPFPFKHRPSLNMGILFDKLGDQLNMVVLFWYLVKRDSTSVGYCNVAIHCVTF